MILSTAALCLALNVYHESRGESIPGQYAVALVTMNRAAHKPANICKTVLAKKQFSWTNNLVAGKSLKPAGIPKDDWAWQRAWTVANVTLGGRFHDFTNGSTHYHVREIKPVWRHDLKVTKVIGKHVFYRTLA